METITITCTNNDKTKEAEVLERNDKYLKVQVPGTQLFIELFRDDVNIPYTGRTAGLEFEWQPKNSNLDWNYMPQCGTGLHMRKS